VLKQKNQNIFWVILACLVLLTSSPATAEISSSHSQHNNSQFQIIAQPVGVKVGVIIAGLGLIGLELWWFIFSKSEVRR
jgi:plastocyanin domain-containing protein